MKNKVKITLLTIAEIIIFLVCLTFSGTLLQYLMDTYGNAKYDILWTVLTVAGVALAAVAVMTVIAIIIIKLSKKKEDE